MWDGLRYNLELVLAQPFFRRCTTGLSKMRLKIRASIIREGHWEIQELPAYTKKGILFRLAQFRSCRIISNTVCPGIHAQWTLSLCLNIEFHGRVYLIKTIQHDHCNCAGQFTFVKCAG